MKKGYKLIICLSVVLVLGYGCTKNDIKDEKVGKIDILDNVIVDINDNKESYKYLKNGEISVAQFEGQGSLKAYSSKNDVAVFVEQGIDYKNINIIRDSSTKSLEVKGNINLLKFSDNGEFILCKIDNENSKTNYKIINTKDLKSYNMDSDIFVSGNVIEFLDDENIIFYGVDISKKISGIFKYNINTEKYSLVREIEGTFVNYIDVVSNQEVVISMSNGDSKCLVLLNVNENIIRTVDNGFEFIEDAVLYDNKVYMSALANNKINLYSVDFSNNKIKRLTYDFPKSLGRDSRLIAEDDKIYFSSIEGKIYFYDIENDSTSILKNQNGIYMILDK